MLDHRYWHKFFGAAELKENSYMEIANRKYVFKNGLLRQCDLYSSDQEQTKQTFGFKWRRRDTYESNFVQENGRSWLIERYLKNDVGKMLELIPPGSRVLDAGCGSGYSALLFFGEYINKLKYLGVDISGAVDVAKERLEERGIRGEFLQADLSTLPFEKPAFDVIFSEGVLHHTDDPEKTFKKLCELLFPGGRFFFYVYKKKGPIREYTDDYIREYLHGMTDEEAWKALMPLTELGKALGDLEVKVRVPKEISFLNIPAGEIEIQRLFYWHVFKAFYRPGWSYDEMNHINFDWYRPKNCYRYTTTEIRSWCDSTDMEIEHMDVQESGITVIARRR